MQPALTTKWRTFALFGLGAALVFLVDPQNGKRRRAYVRNKTRHGAKLLNAALTRTWTRTTNRMHGIVAVSRRLFGPCVPPDDDVLVARVRARVGHLVSHPHAIEVTADHGRVSVTGDVPPAEARKLLRAVAGVQGVSSVDNHLEPEATPPAALTH